MFLIEIFVWLLFCVMVWGYVSFPGAIKSKKIKNKKQYLICLLPFGIYLILLINKYSEMED